ncbi:hypothetical protein A2U01_0048126, partial [Trifolium medium]|nr:hypothetical protein [Trifolium medium]
EEDNAFILPYVDGNFEQEGSWLVSHLLRTGK